MTKSEALVLVLLLVATMLSNAFFTRDKFHRFWRARPSLPTRAVSERFIPLVALLFCMAAPGFVFKVYPGSRGPVLELCADYDHSLRAMHELSARGPWENEDFGKLDVSLTPLEVQFRGVSAPTRLLLPKLDGVLAFRWPAGLHSEEGLSVFEGEVQLMLECRPPHGYQVGQEGASLSLDGGRSYSLWLARSAGKTGVISKTR